MSKAMDLALQAFEAIEKDYGEADVLLPNDYIKARNAFKQALADEALDTMADNARELGLTYENGETQ